MRTGTVDSVAEKQAQQQSRSVACKLDYPRLGRRSSDKVSSIAGRLVPGCVFIRTGTVDSVAEKQAQQQSRSVACKLDYPRSGRRSSDKVSSIAGRLVPGCQELVAVGGLEAEAARLCCDSDARGG